MRCLYARLVYLLGIRKVDLGFQDRTVLGRFEAFG